VAWCSVVFPLARTPDERDGGAGHVVEMNMFVTPPRSVPGAEGDLQRGLVAAFPAKRIWAAWCVFPRVSWCETIVGIAPLSLMARGRLPLALEQQ